MEIIKSYIDRKKLDGNKNITKDMCFFDIETTGFNRKSDIVYLVGILYFDRTKDSWILDQYFANELNDEPILIMESAKFLMGFETIINYNGNSFDIPFINSKLDFYKIPLQLDKSKSLDLYSILRKNKNLLEVENLKLKTVEKYLGIYREDMYSGKDCIDFYTDYILTGDEELKDRLLKHNYDDLYYLIDIIDVLDIVKSKKSFTIPKKDGDIEFLISNIKETKNTLVFKGEIQGLKEKFIYYDSSFDLFIDNMDEFKLTIQTSKGLVAPNTTCTFINKTDFNLSNLIKASHNYRLPANIFLLKIQTQYLHEDMLSFLKEVIENII
nr:ribonuclease H-like domain-containing protein [Tissierella sp.]